MTGHLKKGTRPWARHVLSDMAPLREECAYLVAEKKHGRGGPIWVEKRSLGKSETNLRGSFSCVRLFISTDLVFACIKNV